MTRSTRRTRGLDVTTMQDDPEAILRSRRPATRRTGNRSAHANTSDPSLHQTQDQGGPGHEAAQTELPPQQPASDTQAEDDGDSAGQGTAGEAESITKDGMQADNVTSSTNAQENNGGCPNEAQSKEPPEEGNGHSGAGEKHTLGEEEKEEPDPKRSRRSSRVAGRSGNQENADQGPAQTACEKFRNSLETLRNAVPPGHVAPESESKRGNPLPDVALHQAIASVTEAISERGNVLFSLADRVFQQQPAARPGQSMLWAQHRARSDVTEGGHFSLLVITEGEGDQYLVEHRDSYGRMRNDDMLQPMWQEVREQLLQDGTLNWNRGGAQQLPQQVQVPAAQCTQTNSWTCGLYTIFNAWVHALGLPRPGQPRRTAAGFDADACDLVKSAMEGTVGSATIRDFLECHNFIVPGAQVPADRSFPQTIAFPSPNDLMQRVARVRLADELHNYRIANPGSDVPSSIDDMLPTILKLDSERRLELITSIEDMIQLYRYAHEALQPANSFNQADADESDEAAAIWMQQEEYGRPPPPSERNQGNVHASDAEIAQQLQSDLNRPTAQQPPPPASDEGLQATDQLQQEADGASSVPASAQGQQLAASREQSAGDQQEQTSGNESLQEGLQANDTPITAGTMNRPGGSALDTPGAANNTQIAGPANRPGAEAQQPNGQPGVNADQTAGNANQATGNANQATVNANQATGNANQASGNANQPNGAAGNQEAELEARRQRARALLYPENDPFAPAVPCADPYLDTKQA